MSTNRPLTPARADRDVVLPRASGQIEKLFRSDYAKLVRAAWMLSGSREVAEDIVQDVFAQMIASSAFVNADDPGSYIYRAVINRLRSWQRRQGLERRQMVILPETTASPPEISGFREFLAVLSDRQRTAVVLRYYCDLPLAEVARLMGCRTGTVSVLLRRALHKGRTMKEVFDP
ncbi:MAG TPA: sigma-70 family RNA polymerase sigma factor [Mycobacterium sp.]